MVRPILRYLRGLILWTPIVAIAACAPKAAIAPAPAPPAIKVLVPVPQPCEVQKVHPSRLVTEELGAGDDLYEAVKRVLADRETLMADRTKLVAANSDPCPEKKL